MYEFVNKVKEIELEADDRLVSFDIWVKSDTTVDLINM